MFRDDPVGTADRVTTTAAPALSPKPTRLRYRLDGVDPEWRDPPAAGLVKVMLEDGRFGAIDGTEVPIRGETPGWSGRPETSDFAPLVVEAVVPKGSLFASIYLLSHNPDSTVGVMAFTNPALEIIRGGTSSIERVPLPIDSEEPGKRAERQGGRWSKTGNKLPMSVFGTVGPDADQATMVTIDDDPTRYGGWTLHQPLTVSAGDRVTFTCTMAHSFGRGGGGRANYSNLLPGTYRFHIGAFAPGGAPTTIETSLPIEVYLPWWLRRDVWAAAAATGLVATVAGVRSAGIRRMKRRLVEIERAHALERERTRIARDLHDDVGAGLTEIAMKAEWVRDEIEASATPEALGLTDEIRASAHSLVRGIDAIVWAVNPANDTLERFAAYVVQATEQFLDAAGLDMRFDIPAHLPPATITGAVRHRLFLAAREAVHNAVKHAAAHTVSLTLAADAGRLALSIVDDGRGFDVAAASGQPDHDGLDNMRKRLAEIGGSCVIQSTPGSGTRVTFTVPLSDEPPPDGMPHA